VKGSIPNVSVVNVHPRQLDENEGDKDEVEGYLQNTQDVEALNNNHVLIRRVISRRYDAKDEGGNGDQEGVLSQRKRRGLAKAKEIGDEVADGVGKAARRHLKEDGTKIEKND